MHNKAWGRRGREWQELLYRGRSLGFEPRSQSSLRPWKANLFSCFCKTVTLKEKEKTLKESALLEWPGRTIRVCWSSRLRASLGSHPLAFLQLSMFILVYITIDLLFLKTNPLFIIIDNNFTESFCNGSGVNDGNHRHNDQGQAESETKFQCS